MVAKWLFEKYGQPFIRVQPYQTLAEIKALVQQQPNPYIVVKDGATWYSAQINQLIEWDKLSDEALGLLQVTDLPLLPFHDVITADTDEEIIEERLTELAGAVVLVVDEQEAVVGLLYNRVRSHESQKPVHFTAFHPLAVAAKAPSQIHLYAHLESVQDKILKDAQHNAPQTVGRPLAVETDIRPGTLLTVMADYKADELAFKQDGLMLRWNDDWVRFTFDFEPKAAAIGKQVTVTFSVQIAAIEIASVAVTIFAQADNQSSQYKDTPAKRHQNIFISYSRRDAQVVRRYYQAQIAAGNTVFLDVESLHSGEKWKPALEQAIDAADFIQLFWSEHSSKSEFVTYEWQYCLESKCVDKANCEFVIRPVYWQNPMPSAPKELSQFNFKFVPFK
jgi:hypothetical protein